MTRPDEMQRQALHSQAERPARERLLRGQQGRILRIGLVKVTRPG